MKYCSIIVSLENRKTRLGFIFESIEIARRVTKNLLVDDEIYGVFEIDDSYVFQNDLYDWLKSLGCPTQVAINILCGIAENIDILKSALMLEMN